MHGAGLDLPAVRRTDLETPAARDDLLRLEAGLDVDPETPDLELQDLEHGRGLVRGRIDAAGLIAQEAEAESLEKGPDLGPAEAVEDRGDEAGFGRGVVRGREVVVKEVAAAAAGRQELFADPGQALEHGDRGRRGGRR